MAMPVYYVAHPVAGDVSGNIARALRWLRWLTARTPDVTFIAPWIPMLLSGEDDSDPVARARGLEHDVNVVKRCDGLVLVGGRVSSGMALERDAMIAAQGPGSIIDYTRLGAEPPIATEV